MTPELLSIESAKAAILTGQTTLGIEFGSTRIKAALIDSDARVLATGSSEWENQFENQNWTYSQTAIWAGLHDCYADLAGKVQQCYGVTIQTIGAVGISAMMHGYLAFDQAGELLVPFRTWRNTTTAKAAEQLTQLFGYNIPQRWSIAHLYQAMLKGEEHVSRIASINTLSGYVHWMLTGERVIGIGDASGMFPVDSAAKNYNEKMVTSFDALAAEKGMTWQLAELLPQVLPAGVAAGTLSAVGANLIDPSGALAPGIRFCPPEGDAGTGMVATNSVARRSGNVSAGTSIFAMIVLEHDLAKLHTEIDMVTTPAGDAVAMVHCNNGASELNEWCSLFAEFAESAGANFDSSTVFETLFSKALEAEPDAGGLLAFNYLAGEPITGLAEGRPLFVRTPDSSFTLANFIRAQLYAVFGTLQLGMRILETENVELDAMFAHGGIFRTKGIAQRYLAAALNVPVTVGATAGEGGPWGMAVLAAYLLANSEQLSLDEYLNKTIFATAIMETLTPDPIDVAGFEQYLERYIAGLAIERAASASI